MSKSRRAALLLGLLVSLPALAGTVELLDQPARSSLHLLDSLQTAVARAGDRLVSVGERGLILLSDDNGAHWRRANSPVSVLLTNVFFVSPQQGWVIGHGGVVLATTDGGENWVKQIDGLQAAQIELAAAQAADPGAPGYKHRLTEAQRLVDDGADKPLLGIHFSDAQHGLVVGAYGLALATDDGGKSWRSMIGQIDNAKYRHLYAVLVTDKATLIAGEEGRVFRSTDGGKSFAAIGQPGRGTFFGLVADAQGDIVAFGLRGDAFRSKDYGDHWDKIDLPPSGLNGGTRIADGRLVLVDDWGEVLVSSDGGKSFAPVGTPQAMKLVGVVQAADGALVAAGNRGNVRISLDGKAVEQGK
jgi:photosystem II stability/assembly factor-like uncharacterized protein